MAFHTAAVCAWSRSNRRRNCDRVTETFFKFNWVTGSLPKFDTLLASWYPTYIQSFIISHSSCAEQYVNMSSDTQTQSHTHTHTIKPPTAGVQLDIRPYQNKFCKAKEQAYLTYVRPILEYSCTVWDPYRIYQQRQREMVQRRAARFVCNQYHQTSSITNMMAGLDCEPLIKPSPH